MNRRVCAIGLCVALAGCSAASLATNPPSSPPATSQVAPTPSSEAHAPAPTASAPVATRRLVAYASDGGVWVATVDGTGAHQLLPKVENAEPLAWSADGSRLLFRGRSRFGLTDTAGSDPVLVDLQCPPAAEAHADLASCEADRSVSLSPDGTRLAYPIWEGRLVQGSPVTSSLVVMDLGTGRVTKVGSTEVVISGTCGENRSPRWSPDGKRLAFVRTTESHDTFDCPEALLTVNVDGTDARQVVAPGQLTGDLQANWSPDGWRILVDGFAGYLGKERPLGEMSTRSTRTGRTSAR